LQNVPSQRRRSRIVEVQAARERLGEPGLQATATGFMSAGAGDN
jgi:hypothetical protein